MPVTEGSARTIGEDTAVKNTPIVSEDIKTKTVQEEEEYSVPEEAESQDHYSAEEFDEDVKSPSTEVLKAKKSSKEEVKAATPVPDNASQEEEYEMDYMSEEGASPDPQLPRQFTQEIDEESGLETQNTGFIR